MDNVPIGMSDIQSICWWKDSKILEMAAIIRSLEAKVKDMESKLNGNINDRQCQS